MSLTAYIIANKVIQASHMIKNGFDPNLLVLTPDEANEELINRANRMEAQGQDVAITTPSSED